MKPFRRASLLVYFEVPFIAKRMYLLTTSQTVLKQKIQLFKVTDLLQANVINNVLHVRDQLPQIHRLCHRCDQQQSMVLENSI